MTGDSPFHFSPRPNRAGEIQWREWREDAFRQAKESGKPILLSLSAVWCHWCHVMDETSYSDPDVIAYINDHFVPVRVDNDQRPDVNSRYNMGGWPTTAFLTPEGETLAGGTYLPPDQMRELLPRVHDYYQQHRDEVEAKALEMRERRSAAVAGGPRAQLGPAIFESILRSVVNAYDPVFGGFGEAPKFPHSDAIDLLLYAYRKSRDPDLLHMARKTLEFMDRGHVFDQEWGGFFRYATQRDWSQPHYEKMLEDNAGLLRNLLSAYRITGERERKERAARTIDYIGRKLRDEPQGYFYGSQDADEEFYQLPAAEREQHPEPYIDRKCYASWNAMMASAYLEASWTLARPDLRDAAVQTLAFLWQRSHEPDTGMFRYYDGTPHVPGLLADQAYAARAFLDAHEVTGDSTHLKRALELARLLEEHWADRRDDGVAGFWDVWDRERGPGRLGERQKALPENAVCADVFTRLYHLTRDEHYRDVARGTLDAFASGYEQMGYFAAAYAKQVDLVLNPPAEINIVGFASSAEELHEAALSVDLPARVVQILDPQRDIERLAALMLPGEPAPAAYVCLGTMCSAPVTEPDDLEQTVRHMQQGGRIIELHG